MRPLTTLLRPTPVLLVCLVLAGAASAGPSITGVCPDGSMFIVKKAADIPCPQAKQVDPQDMPPIRPAYLPRPYGWQVFQNKQDPNNPYNLVDRAKTIREAGEPIEDSASGPAPTLAPPHEPQQRAALPPVAAPAPPPALTLSADERRDLTRIVSLSQRRAAARFGSEGAPVVVELAHSRAFEARLHEHYANDALGPVVLFTVAANSATTFHPNFTFVQGHGAFHPGRDDPKQLGVLTGSLGALAAGDHVLGYTVLPAHTDLTAPLDIYWNDRRISVALSP